MKEIQRRRSENKTFEFYPCPNCKKKFFGMVVELCKSCEEKEALYDMDWSDVE